MWIILCNKQGAKIAEQILVNLPGGSDGYNGNGSSFFVVSFPPGLTAYQYQSVTHNMRPKD